MQALPLPSRLLGKGIVAADIGRDALQRVAIHQLALIHGMTQAADFVLDLTQSAASLGIDDLLKAVLMSIAFLRDQVAALEKRMRA